ncbi:MAG: BadF/BadG/BcrA/BcrD ATPase family protein [Bacteroidota bacterium]
MRLADCGSTWTKLWDERGLIVLPTKEILGDASFRFDRATGHMAKSRTDRYENELIALAAGALALIGEDAFTVVDVGSRDTKYVSFKGRKLARMDWNQACGASTGFTLELLAKYYEVDYDSLEPAETEIPVTCGVFAMERVFDAILQGGTPARALASMVRGVAKNVHSFAGNPEKLYLSGGLCENRCFLRTLEGFAEVVPLGRTVLLEGLKALDGTLP